jgi:phosphate transport system substrate-binding protein
MKMNKDVVVINVASLSGLGLMALVNVTTNISVASRDLKTEEGLKFSENS